MLQSSGKEYPDDYFFLCLDMAKTLANTITRVVRNFRPVTYFLDKVRQPVQKAINFLRKSWFSWVLKKLMKPVEWVCNSLLAPVRNVIKTVVERMNPFANHPFIKFIKSKIVVPSFGLSFPNFSLSFLNGFKSLFASWFDTIREKAIKTLVAIMIRCQLTIYSALFDACKTNMTSFLNMFSKGSPNLLIEYFKSLMVAGNANGLSSAYSMVDAIEDWGKHTLRVPIQKIDNYIIAKFSNSGGVSLSSTASNESTASTGPYTALYDELDICRGPSAYCWVLSPAASILVLKQVVGVIHTNDFPEKSSRWSEIMMSTLCTDFLPVKDSRGQYVSKLFKYFWSGDEDSVITRANCSCTVANGMIDDVDSSNEMRLTESLGFDALTNFLKDTFSEVTREINSGAVVKGSPWDAALLKKIVKTFFC